MARVLSKAALSRSLLDGVLSFASNRAYTARAGLQKEIVSTVEDKIVKRTILTGESCWVPDPVTGHYRPATGLREMDAAELRALLLKSNARKA